MKDTILRLRHFSQVFRIWFPAVLAAAMVLAAGRASAQPAAAASNAAAVQAQPASGAAAQPAAPKSEEEELNVYRHAPIVRTLARMLHLKVEPTARIFEGINFAVLALCIVIPLVRFFPKVIRKRTETLRHDLDAARKMTEEARTRLSAIEAQLSGLDAETEKFRAEVEQEMGHDEARIKASLEVESARILAAAEQEIGAAAAQARRSLERFAADLAIEQAARQMVLTPETDHALIAEFTAGLGLNGSTKGGQN